MPEAFGISSLTISRRFIKVSPNKLRELMERDLSGYDFVAVFMDNNSFARDEMIIALGVMMSGKKVILGFIQAATEKMGEVKDCPQGLIDRGLPFEQGLLCVIDGAKGIRPAIQKVAGERALVQRCQWHKRENVLEYLPKHLQAT